MLVSHNAPMQMSAFRDMFALGLPVAEKMLRPVIIYLFLIVLLRLAGKRELAQLNTFDLVVLLMLSNTVQNAIIGEDSTITGGIIGAATLLAVNAIVVRFLYAHESLDRVVEGEPEILIDNGVVQHDRLRGELITIHELEAAAHKQGFASLDEIDRAVLDAGGTIAFFARKPTGESIRHEEIMRRLDQIAAKLAELHA